MLQQADTPTGITGTPGPETITIPGEDGKDGEEFIEAAPMEPGLLGHDRFGQLVRHPATELARDLAIDTAKIAKLNLDAGISERAQSLDEAQFALITAVFRALMTHPMLNLTAEQRAIYPQIIGELCRTHLSDITDAEVLDA
jgi:hypothetical protein